MLNPDLGPEFWSMESARLALEKDQRKEPKDPGKDEKIAPQDELERSLGVENSPFPEFHFKPMSWLRRVRDAIKSFLAVDRIDFPS